MERLLSTARLMPAVGLSLAASWSAVATGSAQPDSPQNSGKPAARLSALPQPEADAEGPFATATLLSESASVLPGSIATLAVHFTIADGWHTYWNGRSDTGFPFRATWTLPPGFEISGPLQWPAPKRYISPGDILDHVYEQRVAILVPLRVPADALPGERVKIAADLTWLVCKSACVFEQGSVSIELPIAKPGAVPLPSSDASVISSTRAGLPVPLEAAGGGVTARIEAGRLEIQASKAGRIEFYPLADCVETPSLLRDGTTNGQRLSVGLGDAVDSEGKPRRVRGVVMIRDRAPAAASPVADPAKSSAAGGPETALLAPRFFSIDLAMPDASR